MKSTVIDQQAIVHRGRTFKPLREAIGSLGAKNADAVLIASVLLCWQAPEWCVPLITPMCYAVLIMYYSLGADGRL